MNARAGVELLETSQPFQDLLAGRFVLRVAIAMGQRQQLTAQNSEGSDERRADAGRAAQQPILAGPLRDAEPNERLDLISRGSDVQIEEADEG